MYNFAAAFHIMNSQPLQFSEPAKHTQQLKEAVGQLSRPESLEGLFREQREGYPLPSWQDLEEIIQLLRSILFPGYFGKSQVNISTIKYQIGVNVERLDHLLTRQVLVGLCMPDTSDCRCDMERRQVKAAEISAEIISRLPAIRHTLATDVRAAYDGDPAAQSMGEVISCYPSVKALTNYRVAHELQLIGVPLIPRMITERAHSETGIDIHPAAQIGSHFAIDHGTGVVIGATCVIGNHVKVYQGVTLGAKSFPLDADGNPIKGKPRHPIIEDNVVIYANATILGRITIGHDSVIGANTWILDDVKPNTTINYKS